ncbi:MAG TPA: T9SS type A sorting domain-containing protein, partial [Flavobacteriales bacterium]|nr:T9SS type A sorting domain-containing protein [Flavobacteriales bacterium]
RYTIGGWDTLGVLRGQIMTMVEYHDTLIAGGQFTEASGTPCQGIAYYNGQVWHPYGELEQSVRRLRVLDDELYAVGGFNIADGQTASGVAKRVGNTWVPLGSIDYNGIVLIDVAKYDGKIVAVGDVNMDGGRGIIEWDGTDWHLLGPGIINGMSAARCLTVYQGDLYVGGQIALAPGNPGQNIMRWDGTEFQGLGQGIQWQLGNTTSIATVLNLVEHNGVLFVGGGFRAAGGILADGLATWDGAEWCAVPGDFTTSNGIWGMDFYYDTLFVACGWTLDGDSVNMAAKFVGEEYQAECSGPVGLPERARSPDALIAPNPADEHVDLLFNSSHISLVSIHDAQGRLMFEQHHFGNARARIDVSNWPPGMYSALIRNADAPAQMERFVIMH